MGSIPVDGETPVTMAMRQHSRRIRFQHLGPDSIILDHIPDTRLLPVRHTLRLWQDIVVYHNHRPRLESRGELPQDLNAVLVRPAVKYLAQEVNVGIMNWLLGEEVMSHERHAAGELGW
jgi:hypothetical protein